MTYKLVIFDFDGTLADSFPWALQVMDDVADRYRLRRINRADIDAIRHGCKSSDPLCGRSPLEDTHYWQAYPEAHESGDTPDSAVPRHG